VANATHQIFIFKPLGENKSRIYRKNLNILNLLQFNEQRDIFFSTKNVNRAYAWFEIIFKILITTY
jgi:hypothetical protein